MLKTFWLSVLLTLVLLQAAAQTAKKITVNAVKTSLSRVLLDLKKEYGIQFAFDDDILSKYVVSVNRTFQSEEEALKYLLKGLPFELEKSGEVFLIIPLDEETVAVQPVKTAQITGQVLEAHSFEPLPFSYVSINNQYIQTDQQGNFNFMASADTTFNLRISHLGYYVFDTLLSGNINTRFFLEPHIEQIQQVIVEGSPVERSTLIGDQPGRMKINHRIAPVLPGHGDNSVFNLLRLMPGILASGEQSNDLLIWGSYESQSKIQFDGFTLFGLKNFNDNISIVNPLMVKNIEVMKGGYEARYGERVGGIVDITGKAGTLQKPTFAFNINTSTVNSLLELPFSKKSTLLAAYRQTYYQLYDPAKLQLGRSKNNNSQSQQNSLIGFDVIPDYVFRDANLKYVYRGDHNGQLSVSLYGGGDRFDYGMEGGFNHLLLLRTEEEQNRQLGSSTQWSKRWENGNSTSVAASYSVYEKLASEQNRTENTRTGKVRITRNIASVNNVDEFMLNAEHNFSFLNGHRLVGGAGIIFNQVSLSRKSFEEQKIDLNSQSSRMIVFVQDELPVGKALSLKSGLRYSWATNLKKGFAEPRISVSVNPAKSIKLNASWGLYNQFMSKTLIVDSLLNYAYFWTNSDGEDIPVLHAQHWVGGISVYKNGFDFSAEFYYKTTDGLTRFYSGSKRFQQDFYTGDAKTSGLDLFIKKEYKKHVAWISYTLCKTLEHYPFYGIGVYRPAPQSQQHELKAAGIFNFSSFYFSMNYVYGSGFERYDFENQKNLEWYKPYSRLDAALVYRFRPGKVKAELGVSVLNVLNTENIKYSDLRKATVDDVNLVDIYSGAVPFTPALFLNIEL